jgi:hypothetical protein
MDRRIRLRALLSYGPSGFVIEYRYQDKVLSYRCPFPQLPRLSQGDVRSENAAPILSHQDRETSTSIDNGDRHRFTTDLELLPTHRWQFQWLAQGLHRAFCHPYGVKSAEQRVYQQNSKT